MNRCYRAILAPLLAVGALWLGLAENASAGFNPAAQNPHYGQNLLWESEASASAWLQPADPTKGNGEWIYDSPSGVPAYVRQNPWSYFDPEGLETYLQHYPAGKNGLGSSTATVTSRKYILFGEKRVTAIFGAIGGTQKERESKLKKLANTQDFDSVVVVTAAAIIAADRIIQSQRDISEENDEGERKNAASGEKLKKQLASEEQLGELHSGKGEEITGPNSEGGKEFRDAPRLASEHGGNEEDWQKVRSSSHTGSDGTKRETHAVQNSKTKVVVEPKTKITQTADTPKPEPKYSPKEGMSD